MKLNNRYVIIDDKLIPEEISSIVLAGKIKSNPGTPLENFIQYQKGDEDNLLFLLEKLEKSGQLGTSEGSFLHGMIKKMTSVNGLDSVKLRIRVYQGKNETIIIDIPDS